MKAVINNIKITTKITILIVMALLSLGAVTIYSTGIINSVKITGKQYNRIESQKELLAQILPPSYNILQAYQVSLFLVNTLDSPDARLYIEQLGELEEAYLEQHRIWSETLDEGKLKNLLTKNAYGSAVIFFKGVNDKLIPAVNEQSSVKANLYLRNTLTPAYLQHIFFIEQAVGIAQKEGEKLEKETENLLKISNILIIAIPIFVGLILFILSLIVRKSISRSMKRILKKMRETSTGDFTQRIEDLGKDEIGIIGNYLNDMVKSISQMIGNVKNTSIKLSDVGKNLQINMSNSVKSIDKIATNISHINSQVDRQVTGVDGANSAVGEIVQKLEGLNIQIESQSASVVESSSAIEEMVANIKSVNKILDKNSLSVEKLKNASEKGRTGMEEVANLIQNISSESEGLISATDVIQNIASQTSLLAMNAAIEAAHAGDAGKGFAVVADEIRKLAEDSDNQSKSISNILNELKTSIDQVASFSVETQDQFQEIFSLSELVKNQEGVIKNAMEEQDSGGSEVLAAIREITEVTEIVRNYSSEILDSSHGIINEMEKLNSITRDINSRIINISDDAGLITNATNQTQKVSEENENSIKGLLKDISHFTINDED